MRTPSRILHPSQFEEIAWRAFRTHISLHRFESYTGILSLHGLARLAVRTGDPACLEQVREQLRPFQEERMIWNGNFPNYFCGGNGAAYLFWKGLLPEAEKGILQRAAEQDKQPRDRDGLFSFPKFGPQSQHIWIDTIFAVTPFYLYAGLALENRDWIDEAVDQSLGHYKVLLNKDTGLLHQSREFAGPGKLSDDHWSRGNGWGLHALSALILDLPKDHPKRREVESVFVAHVDACLAVRDPGGLWYQEMTDPMAYIETSGSFLILQALGAGMGAGVLDETYRTPLWEGLREGMNYLTPEGWVFHTCRGCLCPDDGSKKAYMARPAILNDPHAFGPVIHAFEQAMPIFGKSPHNQANGKS